jgi:aspartate kinase
MTTCLLEGEQACRAIAALGELTPQANDLISSLGERLSAPLVAASLAERGLASQAVEATELLITNCHHGGADPEMEMTCHRCEARLRPLLEQGIIPVVTGFLGATLNGTVTTLGRGGSDYSATIIGAALGAEEIVLWTDVDGVLTADPRWVPDASPIPEISYRQAATLAHFGAKVLHPKTLRPLCKSNIPVWIRNTFSAVRPGTRIIPQEHRNGGSAKGLAAIPEATLIGVRGRANGLMLEWIQRTRAALAEVNADFLFHSQPTPEGDFWLAVRPSQAEEAIGAVRRAFAADPRLFTEPCMTLEKEISVITVVGEAAGVSPGLAKQAVAAMRREGLSVIASAQDASECSFSLALAQEDMNSALIVLHREFHLEGNNSNWPAHASAEKESHCPARAPQPRLLSEENGD